MAHQPTQGAVHRSAHGARGTGGAARAVAVALFEEPLQLGIWSRRRESAQALADQLATSLSAQVVVAPFAWWGLSRRIRALG